MITFTKHTNITIIYQDN